MRGWKSGKRSVVIRGWRNLADEISDWVEIAARLSLFANRVVVLSANFVETFWGARFVEHFVAERETAKLVKWSKNGNSRH